MIALPAPLVRALVRTTVRPLLSPGVPVPRQRRLLDLAGAAKVVPRGLVTTRSSLGGRPVARVSPRGATGERAVLYLHGGGYTVGSARTHGALVAHLAAASGTPVHLLDYRMAPEHPYPAALDDAVAAYRELLSSGVPGSRIAVAGDSAGGGLALALALRLRAEDLPAPAALALVSPWADLTLGGVADDPVDPMLTRAWLSACAARYAPDEEVRAQAWVSPLHASKTELAGLPPVLVHGSSDEILLPDVERLVEHLRSAGVTVEYRRLDGLWHVAHLQAGVMREATAAVRELGGFLGRQLGPA
jgi:acetyl esterase/lipase